MSVYKKLQEARVRLHSTQLNKSGKNNYAGFSYFELADFIPQATKIFNDVGLCGVVSFTHDTACLTVHDADGNGMITFASPLVMAENAKGQAIQSLGSTHTYYRRYLWLMCMEITENDMVDSVEQKPAKPEMPVDYYIGNLQAAESPAELRTAYALSYPKFNNNKADQAKLVAAYEQMKVMLNETSTTAAG
jgi:hypothetical protein